MKILSFSQPLIEKQMLFFLSNILRRFDEKTVARGREFLEYLELAPNPKNAKKVRFYTRTIINLKLSDYSTNSFHYSSLK